MSFRQRAPKPSSLPKSSNGLAPQGANKVPPRPKGAHASTLAKHRGGTHTAPLRPVNSNNGRTSNPRRPNSHLQKTVYASTSDAENESYMQKDLDRGGEYSEEMQEDYESEGTGGDLSDVEDLSSEPPSDDVNNQQPGSLFSKLLTEKKIAFENDYPKDNKILVILSKTLTGSMYLLGYKKDKDAGLLESAVDELEVSADTLTLDPNEDLPAICLDVPAEEQPKTKKKLTRYFRLDDLARFIVEHEVNRIKSRLSADDLKKLAEETAALFPCAGTQQLWFQPSITINHHTKPASGKLCRAVRKISMEGFNLGLFSGRCSYDDFDEKVPSNVFEDLKHVIQLNPEVMEKWLSIQSELEDFFSKTESIEEIYDTFPILTVDEGYTLLTAMFDEGNPELKEDGAFFKKWQLKAITILKKALQSEKTDVIKQVACSKSLNTIGEQATLALLTMPLMMKPMKCVHSVADRPQANLETRKRSRTAPKKPSTPSWTAAAKEVQESFIRHIEVKQKNDMTEVDVKKLEDDEVTRFRNTLAACYKEFSLPLSAHIVAIGPVTSIKRSILFIGNKMIHFDGKGSVLRSVEVCFKAMKMLDKDFPRAATAVWQYLEKHIFDMPVPGCLQIVTIFESLLKTANTPQTTRSRR